MYDFVIFGGDIRQIYMAKYFRSLGYSVITYGLSHPMTKEICRQASSLKEALHSGNILIGPVPLSKDSESIPALTSSSDLNLSCLMDNLHKDQILFAGIIKEPVLSYCQANHISCYDFMKEDSVAIENGIATAEGAIMEAISKSMGNLHHAKTLVLGFGRCAKILARKLNALDCNVCVCARKEADLAYAKAFGYSAISLCELPDKIGSFDFLFNTIPSLILTKELLSLVGKESTIIDIASLPGGLDYEAAKELNLNYSLFLGIPGKVAPKASAEILANYCLNKTFYRKRVSP